MARSRDTFERIRPWHITLLTALVTVLLFLLGLPLLEAIELKTYDLRFVSRGLLEPGSPVVIAAIDEKSLDEQGRWPWPRAKIAALVERLSTAGARVIGFDIGFLEPEEGQGTSGDAALAQAMRDSSATVVLGYFFHMADAEIVHPLAPGEIQRRLRQIEPSKYPLTRRVDGSIAEPPYVEAYAPETNIPSLTEAGRYSGYFNVTPDPDGVVRRMPLVIRCGGDLHAPLALQCVRAYLGEPDLLLRVSAAGIDGLNVGSRSVPTDENGRILINYLGTARTFPHLSATDILQGRTPAEAFQDRIVLVGPTAAGIHDFETTPFGPGYPGLEIHASVVDNLLTERYFSKPKWTGIFDLFNILLVCAVTGVALRRLGAMPGAVFLSAFLALEVAITRWMFVYHGAWLNVVYPLLGIVGTGTNLTFYKYFGEERQRKQIRRTFGRYVSNAVIELMLKQPDRLQLGGEEKELSVLFCDLMGFTDYAEKMRPQEMVEIISDFFKEMTDQVFAHQGTLKEYVGDELMAIFGAPMDHPEHATLACRAALAMQQRLRQLREEWPKRGRPPLRARVGVNTGKMLVGNLGSQYRFSYGVLGDNVNLGSRLEGLNKLYGTEIIIGEKTAAHVKDAFRLRLLDWVRVKGRETPESIFELLGPSGTTFDPKREQAMATYAQALQVYREGNWQEAEGVFEEATLLWPQGKAARIMRERCRYFIHNPLPEVWDGVFRERRK